MRTLLFVLLGLIAVSTWVSTAENHDQNPSNGGLRLKREPAAATAVAGTGGPGGGNGNVTDAPDTPPPEPPTDPPQQATTGDAGLPIINGALICIGFVTAVLMIAKEV